MRRHERVLIAGRIMAFRDFGKSAFIHGQDRKGKMRAYVRKDILKNPAFEIFKSSTSLTSSASRGRAFKTKTGELTVLATR